MFPQFPGGSGGGFPFALSGGSSQSGDAKLGSAGVTLGNYSKNSPWLMVAVLGIAAAFLLRR